MEQRPALEDLVCQVLAEMVPSTAEDIAEATGLAPATIEASLDLLTAHYRVMFNPLTKRYSLPGASSRAAVAA